MPGRAKTRLIPVLGREGAAEFQSALISDTLRKVRALNGRAKAYLFTAGRLSPGIPSGVRDVMVPQRGADLGERLEGAFRVLLRRRRAAVVIGTDSPLLKPGTLRGAVRELRFSDAVLGPCPDGGYYLIGLRRQDAGIFRGIRWGSAFAFRDTIQNLVEHGFSCSILKPVADIDRPSDLVRLARELGRTRAKRRLAPATWRFLKAAGVRVKLNIWKS